MLIADAHVHFHACFRRDRFFDAAWQNLTEAASRVGPGEAVLPYLLLTESPGVDYFRRWRDESGRSSKSSARWHVEPTREDCSLTARREDGAALIIVAGRQVPTAERLEVLALGTTAGIPDGLPFHACLRRAHEIARIVCVPWGFGKWSLGRGALVREAVERADPSTFFLGDGAGRPRGGRLPRLFRMAADRGIRVLPGSDPFPVGRHEDRVGTLCFTVAGGADTEKPWERLAAAVSGGAGFAVRGKQVGLISFMRDQVELRLARMARRGREP
jgi:hypothetical protein